MSGPDCPGHPTLAEELREHVGGMLDVLEPLVQQIREQPPGPAIREPASCAACPLCALITVLRGGRSELAARLAEPASEMLAVLRAALEEGSGDRSPADSGAGAASEPGSTDREGLADTEPGTPGRRPPKVQRIAVARDGPPPSVRPC